MGLFVQFGLQNRTIRTKKDAKNVHGAGGVVEAASASGVVILKRNNAVGIFSDGFVFSKLHYSQTVVCHQGAVRVFESLIKLMRVKFNYLALLSLLVFIFIIPERKKAKQKK